MAKKKTKISDKEVNLLVKIYLEAQKAIIDSTRNKDLFSRTQSELMLAQINQILNGLEQDTKLFIQKAVQREYKLASIKVDKDIEKALNRLQIRPIFNLVDPRKIQGLVGIDNILEDSNREIQTRLISAYAGIQKQLSDIKRGVRQELLQTVGTGMVTGDSRFEISKRLKQQLEDRGIKGFTYTTEPSKANPDGKTINTTLESWVKGFARSSIRNANLYAVVSRALERGYDLIQFSTHANCSEICQEFQGQILSITGQTEGYPALQEALTSYNGQIGICNHLYCRHSATVFITA